MVISARGTGRVLQTYSNLDDNG